MDIKYHLNQKYYSRSGADLFHSVISPKIILSIFLIELTGEEKVMELSEISSRMPNAIVSLS